MENICSFRKFAEISTNNNKLGSKEKLLTADAAYAELRLRSGLLQSV